MRITVFGASGKVGCLVTAKLLQRDHQLTLFVHKNSPFDESDKLQIVRGDVHNATDVERAMQDSDAAICTLSSWGTGTKDILRSATQNIIVAMEKQPGKRVVSLTGSGAYAPNETHAFRDKMFHAAFSVVGGKILEDGEAHIKMLHDSSLDWTVLRSPVMTKKAVTKYNLNTVMAAAWETVPREAVAQAIVDQLTAGNFMRQAPHIHRSTS